MIVEKLPVTFYVMLFMLYIVLHLGIGLYKSKMDENEDLSPEGIKKQKIVDSLFKWFPAIYLVGLLLYFYSL